MTTVTEKALDVNGAMLALGCEVFDTEDARFVRNRKTPNVHDANHVSRVRASTPEAIDRLLARAQREFEGMDSLSFHVDHRTPRTFEARLVYEGFESDAALVMLLAGELVGKPKEYEIRLVEGEDAWATYGELHRVNWQGYIERLGRAESWLAREILEARRMKSPPARFWMAYVDGQPQSYLFSWEGVDGIGQVEDLFTHPNFRHQGLATALIHHSVADARAHGAGPVVIVANASDTPKEMYAAMGFRPVAVKRTYRRKL